MESLKQLVDLGKEMGYKDEALQQFVKEEQAKARDEREQERIARQEREERQMEMAERDHRMKLELLEMESKEKVYLNTSSTNVLHVKGPKLPPFEEGKDNMDAYIERFERYATAQKWPREIWSANLSALLKGRALDVFSRLPVAQALDYRELRDALLKRFELTEEGFRRKFRTSRLEQGETFGQFAIRLGSYYERWIDMANVERTYDGLKDLMLRDQFINCCGKELELFLRERIPNDIDAMAKLADQFVDARTNSAVAKQRFTRDPNYATGTDNKSFQQPKSNSTIPKKIHSDRKCYNCGKIGHVSYDCPEKKRVPHAHAVTQPEPNGYYDSGNMNYNRPVDHNARYQRQRGSIRGWRGGTQCGYRGSFVVVQTNSDSVELSVSCQDNITTAAPMPVVRGRFGDKDVGVLRDTGCNGVVIRQSLVDERQMTGNYQSCSLANGTIITVPTAEIHIDTPYYTGHALAWCMSSPVYDLIIGNINGARSADQPDVNWKPGYKLVAVQTRAQKRKQSAPLKPLKVPSSLNEFVTKDEFKTEQESDVTLVNIRQYADEGEVKILKDGSSAKIYRKRNSLIFREFFNPRISSGKVFRQLIVPKKFRDTVMHLAHDSILGGHLATKRTVDRVLSEFYWPGVQADVGRYCRSCDVCQRTYPKGRVAKVPLGNMPLIDEPFKRVAVDLIGPLQPVSDRGNRFILTLVDYATRYPEAVALPGIETVQVAEALVDIFSRVGVPREMLTDQGAQFTSYLMKEISRLLSIRGLTTTPYHPSCNGLVERFNGTLKMMLRRMCAERPKDWDKYINALLFAYREVPQESTGFSPFELLYGRTIRGPMMILKELWTKDFDDQETKNTYQYVVDLRQRLEETCELARQQLQKAKIKQRNQYNRKARDRKMEVGEKVLVLLPTKSNKLLMQWKGPYTIVQCIGSVDYRIDIGGKIKTYHANLLRKYVKRNSEDKALDHGILSSCVIIEVSEEEDNDGVKPTDEIKLPPSGKSKDTIKDVHIASTLTEDQGSEINTVLEQFRDILTDLPGRTTLAEHKITLTTNEPIRVKQYPLPYNTKQDIQKEVEVMLSLDVIEPSESPYSSPVVIVRKKDGTNRFCVDFRMLNKSTIFDAEPMPNTDEIFSRLAGSKYFTKIDLSKGYWQVPLPEDCKQFTAFTTLQGLFQFKVMPFGLVNAPATFSRMMRKLLKGMDNVENFIDDVIVYTDTWDYHVKLVKDVLQRLKDANLTMRPSKCFVGYGSLECLGHVIGNEELQTDPDKLAAIRDAPIPTTKKQVRSFLGLAGFYRKFIPNFATIAAPLTDLTRKGQPNKVNWENSQDIAFSTLKKMLCSSPILKLPELDKEFTLRTDASDNGLRAVLLQMSGDVLQPVAYASRKLLPRERNYAVIEKECLAIVWAMQKFAQYLYGREFRLETDHHPLSYLNKSKTVNARLMRWALQLQQYRFRVICIKGSDNVGADFLSRA